MVRVLSRPLARPLALLAVFTLALATALLAGNRISAQTEVSPLTPTTTSTATGTATPTAQPIDTIVYVVQRGETLSSIARRYFTTVATLQQLNGIADPNRIIVGQRLRIPRPPRAPVPFMTPTPTATPMPLPPSLPPWPAPAAQIELFSPLADGVYHSPVEVIGFSQTFEGSVVVRLSDGEGNVLAQRNTTGGSVDGFDFFHTYLRFTVTAQTEALLEVFEISARDGSEINKVTRPLTLLPGQRVIDLLQPRVGDSVCPPIQVAGYSNTFEANVVVELSGRDGSSLELTNTLGGNLGIYDTFQTTFAFDGTEMQPLLVSAYELDGAGIGPIDHTRVPVSFYPAGSAACP